MKVVFAYKWARNAATAMVLADGSVDWRGAKMTPGEDDPAALATAKTIAQGSDGSVVGLTLGNGDASWALARGVGSTYSVEGVEHLIDNAATGEVLAAAVREIGDVDVVVIGDSKQEAAVAPAIAAELGWPCLLGLVSASVVDGTIHAVRNVGSEAVTTAVPLPAVLGVQAEADVDKAPGMKDVLAARKRPVTKLAHQGDIKDVESQGSRRPEATAGRVFDGDPADSTARLVTALRDEGVL